MRIDFRASPRPTLGVEWEFALVDRRTRDLRNEAAHLFARAKARICSSSGRQTAPGQCSPGPT